MVKAVLALLCGLVAATGSMAEEAAPRLTLQCEGHLAFGAGAPVNGQPRAGQPEAAPDLRFDATLPFEEGHLLVLADPETNRIERAFYDAEVLVGAITLPGKTPQDIVWTRATSAKGGIVGFLVAGNGDVTSLTIRSIEGPSRKRAFTLFSTSPAAAYQGDCR